MFLFSFCRSPFFRALLAVTELNIGGILDGLFSYLLASWMCTCHPWKGRAHAVVGCPTSRSQPNYQFRMARTIYCIQTVCLLTALGSEQMFTALLHLQTSSPCYWIKMTVTFGSTTCWRHILAFATLRHFFNINKSHFYYHFLLLH